jgi:hypothetical protein
MQISRFEFRKHDALLVCARDEFMTTECARLQAFFPPELAQEFAGDLEIE